MDLLNLSGLVKGFFSVVAVQLNKWCCRISLLLFFFCSLFAPARTWRLNRYLMKFISPSFITMEAQMNVKLVETGARVFPHVASSADERIVSLHLNEICPFLSFSPDTWYWSASRCLAVVIWCSLADECVQAHCSSQLWLEILLRLPVCSERVKSFVYGALCCISPRSFLFRLLQCAVLACILPARLLCPFRTFWYTKCCVILMQYRRWMGQNQAQDEMLTCIWKGFCPTSWLGVSGFFTPAQTWTLGVWVVFTWAMGLPQMKKGGGGFRVREKGSHRDSTCSLQPGGPSLPEGHHGNGWYVIPTTMPNLPPTFPTISPNQHMKRSLSLRAPYRSGHGIFRATLLKRYLVVVAVAVVWLYVFACERVNAAHAFVGSSNYDWCVVPSQMCDVGYTNLKR